ncbi:heterokaryon incompatibility, partial [Halenospora varia]
VYSALSYTWGDPEKTNPIQIDGKQLPIPENLWWFFQTCDLNGFDETRLFWIDAICIDQSNVLERNHQVRLMKQIYTTADNVFIWLRREADNSDLAMSFLSGNGTTPLRRKGNGFKKLWTRNQGKALMALCERSYWRRIWIIQEVIHAKRLTVLCGQKSFE